MNDSMQARVADIQALRNHVREERQRLGAAWSYMVYEVQVAFVHSFVVKFVLARKGHSVNA
jgi:hypothetical protein